MGLCFIYFIVWLIILVLFDLRDSEVSDAPAQGAVSHDELHPTHGRIVKFKDPVSSAEVDRASVERHQNENEDSGTWGSSGSFPYSNALEDHNSSFSPNLQPVPEEPSSSFSEGNLCGSTLKYMLRLCGDLFLYHISHCNMQLLTTIHCQL